MLKYIKMPEKGSKLYALFFTDAFRATAVSILNIFNSIFIFKSVLYLSASQQTAILATIGYELAFYLTFINAIYLVDRISFHWGLKKSLFIGQIFLVLMFLYLIASQKYVIYLVFSVIASGLASAFYWFSWNSLLSKKGQVGKFGEELGIYNILLTVFSLATPVIGGTIIYYFGYTGLFGTSLGFVGISFLFILMIEDDGIHHQTAPQEIARLFLAHPRAFWSYFGIAASGTISAIILPLYLFLILKKELSLGIFLTASMIASATLIYFVGRWVDRHGGQKPLALGSLTQTAVWIGRAVCKFPPVLFALDLLDRTSTNMVSLPLSVEAFEKAVLGHNTGRAILFRETASGLGVLTVHLMVATAVFFGAGLEISFLFAALFAIIPLLEIRKKGNP